MTLIVFRRQQWLRYTHIACIVNLRNEEADNQFLPVCFVAFHNFIDSMAYLRNSKINDACRPKGSILCFFLVDSSGVRLHSFLRQPQMSWCDNMCWQTSVGHWCNAKWRRIPHFSERNQFQRHFVHRKSHIEYVKLQLGFSDKKPTPKNLSCVVANKCAKIII